jgi:hypothetical protein
MSVATVRSTQPEHLVKDRLSRMTELDELTLPEAAVPSRDDEAVARLAHAYWEDRLKNNIPGSAEEDWRRAEEELGF